MTACCHFDTAKKSKFWIHSTTDQRMTYTQSGHVVRKAMIIVNHNNISNNNNHDKNKHGDDINDNDDIQEIIMVITM